METILYLFSVLLEDTIHLLKRLTTTMEENRLIIS